MNHQISMFDNNLKASNDWKWKFKDYPQDTNGLKVFSCFACGGGVNNGL